MSERANDAGALLKADAGRSVAEALEAALADVAIGAAAQGPTGPKPTAAMQRVRDVFFEYVARVREQAYEDGRHIEQLAHRAREAGERG